MPWTTPTLRDLRSRNRAYVMGALPGADAMIPNSVLRVLCDMSGGNAYEVMEYIDWLALQLLPLTAETEWLDRHGDIWLVNSDGSVGRKQATYATGTVLFTGDAAAVVPQGTQLSGQQDVYETTQEIELLGTEPTNCSVRALTPGTIGNQEPGSSVRLGIVLDGVDPVATVDPNGLTGGVDAENDDELRMRVLERIRKPPMGGDESDYELWTLAIPGVTRCWVYPQEMGIGTVTVRFMMDDLRANADPLLDGFPLPQDIAAVSAYLQQVRPVTVKDNFVEAPIPIACNYVVVGLSPNVPSVRAAILKSVGEMFKIKSVPGGTMHYQWVDAAIAAAVGENYARLQGNDVVMPMPGYIAVLGSIAFVDTLLTDVATETVSPASVAPAPHAAGRDDGR